MTESKPSVVWKCDRCGATQELASSDQPKDWGRLTWVVPPRRDPSDRSVKWDLCHDCDSALAAFIRGEK